MQCQNREATVHITRHTTTDNERSLVSSVSFHALIHVHLISCPMIINMLRQRTTYSSMKAAMPPRMALIPPTLSTAALPVKVTTPPGAPVPVACGAVPVAFLWVPVNVGALLVETGDAESVIFGAVVVGTTIAEEVGVVEPAGTVLLAWKPAERVMPKPAAQLAGSSPYWGVSWEMRMKDGRQWGWEM